MKTARLCVVLLALVVVSACAGERPPAGYGAVVRFSEGVPVVFPNFTMTYAGERKVASEVFKPGFTFQDFVVKSAKSTQTVSWSGGTGVIDSASFDVDGKPYELELRGSVLKKGWLEKNEMVVWPRAEFLKALERRNAALR